MGGWIISVVCCILVLCGFGVLFCGDFWSLDISIDDRSYLLTF